MGKPKGQSDGGSSPLSTLFELMERGITERDGNDKCL